MDDKRSNGSQTLAFIGVFILIELIFLSLFMLYSSYEKSFGVWWDIMKTITVPLILSGLLSIPLSAIIVKKLEK